MTMAKRSRKAARSEPIDDPDLQAVLKTAIDDAALYIDTQQAPDRTRATNYYQGEPFGNEEEGRSQVVMTEVRDTVLAMMPSLMRVFCSGEIAKFDPQTAADIPMADQQTAYVEHVIHVDNHGYLLLLSLFKDALVRRLGVATWWVDETRRVTEETYEALSPVQVQMLQGDPDVEILEIELHGDDGDGSDDELFDDEDEYQPPGEMDADGEDTDGGTQIVGPEGPEDAVPPSAAPGVPPALDPSQLFDCRIRRTVVDRKIRIEAVPPEEMLISREARTENRALLLSRRRLMRSSEIMALGYSRDLVESLPGDDAGFEFNREAQARNPGLWQPNADYGHEPLKTHLYFDSYLLYDGDGDGVAELRRICSVGSSHAILSNEIVTEAPFAFFTMDPEPHTVIGQSVTDHVGDLQEIKSAIVRGTLDSLAHSIHPRTAVVEGQVNLDDVMNTETGAIIRMRTPGAVQELNSTFVGQQAFPMLGYLDETKAARTGITRATQGLDADVLQSTTKEAVVATTSAAEQRLEYVARCFAETGYRRLMEGVLRTVCRVQDRPRALLLAGKFTEIDPRTWNADLHLTVNIGRGLGKPEERLPLLAQVAAVQKEAIANFGPDNPLCDLAQYRNTLVTMLKIGGERDGDRYFKQIDPAALQQLQQQFMQMKAQAAAPKTGAPHTDPAQTQIEQMKAQTEMAVAHQRAAVEQQRLAMEQQRLALEAKDKAAQAEIRARELDLRRVELVLREREQQAKVAAAAVPVESAP